MGKRPIDEEDEEITELADIDVPEPPKPPTKFKNTVGEFERLFKDVINSDGDGKKDYPVIWSGGIVGFEGISPALFSSEERAINAWLATARQTLPKVKTTLEWLIKPELIEYQTTIADRKQRHRVVSDRYTVKSQFLVNGEPIGSS